MRLFFLNNSFLVNYSAVQGDLMKKNIVSDLASHIGYRLRVVSNAVSHSFARKLATCDITVAEWVILRKMYESTTATSPSVIAEGTGLTRGAVSKLIDRLLSKGLVLRAESVKDRRYQDIQLSQRGRDLVPKLAGIADDNEEIFFSILTDVERKTFMDTLIKLAEHHKLYTNPIE